MGGILAILGLAVVVPAVLPLRGRSRWFPIRSRERKLLALAAVGLLAAIGPASAATAQASHGRWMIEHSQIQYLGTWSQSMRDTAHIMTEPVTSPATADIIHYTRLSHCSQRWMGYRTPCEGLADVKPPPSSIALYDNEGWRLTSYSEQQAPCASAQQFARQVRADGAIPALYLRYTSDWHIKCAAKYVGDGGWFIAGGQFKEGDTATYLSDLVHLSSVALRANPTVTISFGLSTREKYGASPQRMATDWQQVTSRHPHWVCWLNVIAFDGSQWKASKFLDIIGGP